MLTDADLRKIRKLLAPLATRKDIGSSKNLGALWEKYAAIKIKLDQHERLIKELQKKSTLKKEDEMPMPILDISNYAFTAKNKKKKNAAGQGLREKKRVLSVSNKVRGKTSTPPAPTHPPMGWQDGKG